MADHFYVELAPGYVRLRSKLGFQSRWLGMYWSPDRRPLSSLEQAYLEYAETQEVEGGYIPDERSSVWDTEEDLYEDHERQLEEETYIESLDPEEAEEYIAGRELARARKAAEARRGRGVKGMSTRSRQEMWRWVLTLPFEMLGERPLWITLTYPGEWRHWVSDGRTFERHRCAFAEAWFRDFGERPMGLWSKEFQLAEGRPHLHMLLRGPAAMSDADYRGFQALTRLGNANVRRMGKRQGRFWTPPIGPKYGGVTAVNMLQSWSHITTKGQVENHGRRGVNVRAEFYSPNDAVGQSMRRSAIAAYMAGEAAKFGQKVPPDNFGTVGRYFGAFGGQSGFNPTVERLEIDKDVWPQLNRRLTLLDAIRKRAKGRPLSDEAKRRRPWQGLTVGGIGHEEYARLYARAYRAAVRNRPKSVEPIAEAG